MKFLIVDDSGSLRSLLQKRLLQKWPQALIKGYDPHREGRPDSSFPWSEFDIVFLDYQLGLERETGIDWLPEIKRIPAAPSVILVSGHGSESVAVRAIREGADEYLIKYDVVTDKLYEVVETCLAQRRTVSAPELIAPVLPQTNTTDGRLQDTGTAVAAVAHEHGLSHWDIPGYKCLSEIARRLTITLLAERLEDGRKVVLKVQKLQDNDSPVLFKRFSQELNILSDLDHPHIIKVLDQGVTDRYFFYVVDYYPLGDLTGVISGGATPPAKAFAYILQIARGLAALHSSGIVHRDIKPSNILFADADTLVIADLGIAKDLASSEALTAHGQVMGTPFYMSPEQITSREIDHRADIYSLGVLFYELLTGNRPFPGASIMEVAYKHAYDPAPLLPDALETCQPIMDKMLAKAPADRYQDLEQFIQDVINAGSGLNNR